MQGANENVSFYGEFYCGNCDLTWELEPQDDGTMMISSHECEEDNEKPDPGHRHQEDRREVPC